jgi:ABC-2 type transport system permease protein
MRYLKLLTIFYKYSLLKDLEYRVNFLANIFMSVFWFVWAIVGVGVFFLHRDKMGDWSYPEVLMVVALFALFNGIMEALLRPNVGAVIEQVRDGTFDFVLTKPVNSQFIASLRNLVVWRLVDVLIGIFLIVYALGQLHVTPSFAQIAFFIVMLLSGAVIVYSIWLSMVSLAFWFVKTDWAQFSRKPHPLSRLLSLSVIRDSVVCRQRSDCPSPHVYLPRVVIVP